MQSTANMPPDNKGEGKMIWGIICIGIGIVAMMLFSGCSWTKPKVDSNTTVTTSATDIDSSLFDLKNGEYKWLSRDLQAIKTPEGKLQIVAYHQKETVTRNIPVKIKNSNNTDSFNKTKDKSKDKSKVKTTTKTITKTQFPMWMLYWLIGLTVFAVWKSGILKYLSILV